MSQRKKKVKKALLSQKIVAITLILLQSWLLFAFFVWIRDHFVYVYGLSALVTAVLLVIEVNREENADFKLTWVLLIGAIPVFGVLLYLFLHINWVTRKIRKNVSDIQRQTQEYFVQDERVIERLENPQDAGILNYLRRTATFPVYGDTPAAYFPSGEDLLREMLIQLERAKFFIFLEYFIIAPGVMWNSIFRVLKRKVAQGVEVRLMYDGMGCLTLLPADFRDQLEEAGILWKVFSPMKPFLSSYQNNRDHRKILIIDGHIAFTGGVNVGDEYINCTARFGHWKDTAMMIEGRATDSFTLMFLQLWNIGESVMEDCTPYLYKVEEQQENSQPGFVAPYGDSPLDQEYIGKMVYLDMICTAKERVNIMSPYLIIDDEMLSALKFAAKRGVEVRIILPHIPDKWYTSALGRTFYPQLLEAGVKVYEYLPGFIHAKSTTGDGEKGVVGTINYDFRSLYLHYECAVYLYRHPIIQTIDEDFEQTLLQCKSMTMEDYHKLPVLQRWIGRVLRLFAPLM